MGSELIPAKRSTKAQQLREAANYAAEVVAGEQAGSRVTQIGKVVARIHRMLNRLPVKEAEEGIFPKHVKKGYGNYSVMLKILVQMDIIERKRGKGKQTEYRLLKSVEELDEILAARIYIEIYWYNQNKETK